MTILEAKFPFSFLDLTFKDLGLGIWTGTGPRACQTQRVKVF